MSQVAEHRRALARSKLALCVAMLENDEAGLAEDPGHAATWRRLIAEARGDICYWAFEAWLAEGRGAP